METEKIRSKFVFTGIVTREGKYANGEKAITRNMEFMAVYGNSPENKLFWEATPSGKIELQVVSDSAIKQFDIGSEYYVDFIKVEKCTQ